MVATVARDGRKKRRKKAGRGWQGGETTKALPGVFLGAVFGEG